MSRIYTKNLTLGYEGKAIVKDVSLNFQDSQINMLIGANGSGKSTLLAGLIHALKPMSGEVFLDDKELSTVPARQRATTIGLLPQHPQAPEGITVWDLVSRGRFPHQKWYQQFTPEDEKAVRDALVKTNMIEFSESSLQELSGGQQQRAWVAMALAQEASILLLDEPTSFLDIKHQLDILQVVKDLNRNHGITVIMVIHELNFALRFGDHIVAMKNGEVYTEGKAEEIATDHFVAEVFDLDALVMKDPVHDTPMVVPR
ncbi:MAG: ABC transporter ATP-binding protein [Micrococcaceae bacterium]